MKLSVCLATKNGEKYIKEQLRSILDEFTNFQHAIEGEGKIQFEVIIVDDTSDDKTVRVAERYLKNNCENASSYYKILENDVTRGVSASFELAIETATGDFIFLSDQDDIWVDGRLKLLYDELNSEKSVQLVASNYSGFIEDEHGEHQKITTFDQKFRLKSADQGRFSKLKMKLFLKTVPFYGCTFAFRRHLKTAVLPFPHKVQNAYDEWIAYCALSARVVRIVEKNTVLRRIHDNNLTSKKLRKFSSILSSRLHSLGLMSVAANRRHRL
ncbi:MAG: glycosyltransferase [Candidatus Ancillula sp.]|jgi:glycosyltransferase involved in cell wall biosynthesis|nr:glycosyltransferase [Candidatus Ancillula sp.]